MNKWLSRIWEAPQKALAHIIIKLSKATPTGQYSNAKLYHWKWKGGMSLSNYIFLPFEVDTDEGILINTWKHDYIAHEYGHTLQSHKLGLVYLLVIGLPSLIWAGCFDKYRKKHGISYYSFYTEKWADKLGGVERED